MAGWIHRLRASGVEVLLAWMHSTPIRRAEALESARILGVDEVSFLGATDGQMAEEMSLLLPGVVALLARVCPDRVVVPAFEQGHLDHDVTHVLIQRAFDGVILEVPLYYTYLSRLPTANRFADPVDSEDLRLSTGEQDAKRAVLKCYPSQRIETLFRVYDALSRLSGNGSALSVEHLRVATNKDFLTPHLPSHLAQKVAQSPTWHRWQRAYLSFQESVEDAGPESEPTS